VLPWKPQDRGLFINVDDVTQHRQTTSWWQSSNTSRRQYNHSVHMSEENVKVVSRTNHHPHNSLYNCVRRCSRHSSWTARPLKMGPIGCPETSVSNYQSTLCNIPEERRSYLHRDGSLKTRQSRGVSEWSRNLVRKITKLCSMFLLIGLANLVLLHG
jgi:hypothetical protein